MATNKLDRPEPGHPTAWAQAAAALKASFDSVRSVIAMLRDVRSMGGGSEQQQKAIDTALNTASATAIIAEAQIAKALGYELCKCDFPPTAMRTVGYFLIRSGDRREGDPVYECPRCGYCNAGPYGYHRLAPQRATGSAGFTFDTLPGPSR